MHGSWSRSIGNRGGCGDGLGATAEPPGVCGRFRLNECETGGRWF